MTGNVSASQGYLNNTFTRNTVSTIANITAERPNYAGGTVTLTASNSPKVLVVTMLNGNAEYDDTVRSLIVFLEPQIALITTNQTITADTTSFVGATQLNQISITTYGDIKYGSTATTVFPGMSNHGIGWSISSKYLGTISISGNSITLGLPSFSSWISVNYSYMIIKAALFC